MGGEWSVASLGDVVEEIIDRRGVTPKKLGSDFTSAGHRVISAKLMKGGRLDLSADSPRFVDAPTYHRWMKTPLLPDDVLLTSEAPLGETAYVEERLEWCLGQRLFCLRTFKDRLSGRFLLYLLRSEGVRLDLISRATGTTVQGIRQSQLVKVRVPLPPLPEQRRIASILGVLDDKIELNRRMNRTLEEIAQAIFKSWFIDFDGHDDLVESGLGLIPRGWEVAHLGQVCSKPQYGYTASAQDRKIGPRLLRITDINKRPWIEWDAVPFCEAEEQVSEKYGLAPGDLLIARMADPGHAVMIEEKADAVFASYLIRFRPKTYEMAVFLSRQLQSQDYWEFIRSSKSGSAQQNINAKSLAAYRFTKPPDEYLRRFAAVSGPLRFRVLANVGESRTLTTLRDTLLPKLISGEIRVPEAEEILEEAL